MSVMLHKFETITCSSNMKVSKSDVDSVIHPGTNV